MMYQSAALLLAFVAAASAQGCPPTSITFEEYISNRGGTNGACTSSSDCEGNEGSTDPDSTCCVHFSFPYCGVPSECNSYLKCLPEGTPVPLPTSAEQPTAEEFAAALARAAGGGAYYDGCPPTSESWESYQSKGGACTSNAGCAAANEGACCVKYTVRCNTRLMSCLLHLFCDPTRSYCSYCKLFYHVHLRI